MEAVENLEDALLEGGATHYRVVDDDEIVLIWSQTTIGDIIYMGGEVIALSTLGDECAQLDIFPNHLLDAWLVSQSSDALNHSVKCHLCGIGDIRKHRVLNIPTNGLHDCRCELLAQLFALSIYILVRATTEVYALERATIIALRRNDLTGIHHPTPVDYN